MMAKDSPIRPGYSNWKADPKGLETYTNECVRCSLPLTLEKQWEAFQGASRSVCWSCFTETCGVAA